MKFAKLFGMLVPPPRRERQPLGPPMGPDTDASERDG